jgi:DNA polymerase-1
MDPLNTDDKKRLYSLFSNVKDDMTGKVLDKKDTSDVLIIDALNLFIRVWSVSPYMNEDGIHTGGVSGFLKSLGAAIRLLSPTKCILVFDGNGGSLKRRKIYPEYKNKRRTKVRLNRTYVDNCSNDDEEKNLKKQLIRTVNYLDYLPLTVMAVDNVEADDVIAYLALDKFKDSSITIMSSDKDFLQLASDRIKIWSPVKKKLYGCAELLTEYGISCQNFINYRILEGDTSDNISGIPGAGLKTIIKCFPIFTDPKRYTTDEICNYADTHKGRYKLYDTILENKSILERNYALMQLNVSEMQGFTQLRVNEIIDANVARLNRFEFSKLVTEDKIWNNIPNYQIWLSENFGKLDNFVKVVK